MTPTGDYLPCGYTKKTNELPNKTEWNFLFEKTKKVSILTHELLEIAEELIPYIFQDPLYEWKITEIRSNMAILAIAAQNGNTRSSIKGLEIAAEKFAKSA